jgi:hypothetical protein
MLFSASVHTARSPVHECVGHMRISTVWEFRDKATGLLRSRTPILVTRRGRLAGIFFPRPEVTLPIELKRELCDMLSSDVARQLKRRKVLEDDVLRDFEASRKRRRATRRRRQIGRRA